MNAGRFTSEKLKGKSYEERYGAERAKEIKLKRLDVFHNSEKYKDSRKK